MLTVKCTAAVVAQLGSQPGAGPAGHPSRTQALSSLGGPRVLRSIKQEKTLLALTVREVTMHTWGSDATAVLSGWLPPELNCMMAF